MLDNLNIVHRRDDKKQNEEFYKNNLPLTFLSDIKDINIIVGANNSRKSRFMRSIIQLDHRTSILSHSDFNAIYCRGKTLEKSVKATFGRSMDEWLLLMSPIHDEKGALRDLKEYFDKSARGNSATNNFVSPSSLMTLISNITAGLASVALDKDFRGVLTNINQLTALVDVTLFLYGHYQKHGGKVVSPMSFDKSVFTDVNPHIPSLKIGDDVSNIDEKVEFFKDISNWLKSLYEISFERHEGKRIYIPVLRTSRKILGVKDDIFANSLRKQYFNDDSKLEIHTGLKLYDQILQSRNGNRDDIRSFNAFEKFIGRTFFASEEVHIVAFRGTNDDDSVIKISVPNEMEDIPVHQLGDGIQGIINLLFPIYTAREEDWVFIEEPENHLHPSYQNIFISAICNDEHLKGKRLRYFINTHSNHILSSAFLANASTNIMVFSRRDEISSDIYSFDQDQYRTLELLGAMNTSVLISNCTVWVEGVTDRFYLRAFLQAYCDTLQESEYVPKEGYDYSFVEYGGKNLVHYDFSNTTDENNIAAFFLNNRVFLLADSDFDKDKHSRYEKIETENFKYHKTDLPEIENLVPDDILRSFLQSLECDTDSIEKAFPVPANIKLGRHFSKITRRGKPVKFEAKAGGTLSSDYKSRLSQFVYNKIASHDFAWEHLQSKSQLKNIVEDLYEFIKTSNKRSLR